MNSDSRIWGILLKASLWLIFILAFLLVKIKSGWDPIKELMPCDSCDVIFPSIPIDSIKMLDVMRININEPQQLLVQIEPANATQKKLSWTSSNPSVASVVDSTGVVTATGKGDSCVITATAIDGSGKSASITIIVNKRKVIKQPDGEIMVKVNEPYKVEVETSAQNASYKSLKWISSNPDIARVNQNGVVIGRKAGECVITATYTDGSNVSDSLIVKVADDNREILITSILLKDIKIEEGTTVRLRPVISPSNATNTDLDWSSDSKNVLVSSKGVVTGNKSGVRAVITAKATDGSGEKASCIVEVFNNRGISVFHGKAVYNQQKRTITIVKELELDLHKNDGRSITLYPGDIIEGVRVKDGYLKMGELNHNGKMTLLDGLNNKL